MAKQLKLIWDFRGPSAHQTAKHHLIHLNEYAVMRNINLVASGVDTINTMHSIAYMVVNESEMHIVRDALKPHRGQLYNTVKKS